MKTTKKSESAKTERVTINVSLEDKEKLTRLAITGRGQLTISEVIRELLRKTPEPGKDRV
jgi:hypothetical protein